MNVQKYQGTLVCCMYTKSPQNQYGIIYQFKLIYNRSGTNYVGDCMTLTDKNKLKFLYN